MRSYLRSFPVILAGLAAACSSSVAPSDSGALQDSGPAGRSCGRTNCASNEICCLATGQCFDPAQPEQCRVTRDDAASSTDAAIDADGGSRSCASNLDCPNTEMCFSETCLGTGRCMSRTNGSCTDGLACGCDGLNYRSPCEAIRQGVRVASFTACGVVPPVRRPNETSYTPVIGCGNDSQCPQGMTCCGLSSRCVRANCEGCCAIAPRGSVSACELDTDCESSDYFCDGPGCAGAGGCRFKRSISSCTGVVDNVCGCDGRTYGNECQLKSNGVRLRSLGACP